MSNYYKALTAMTVFEEAKRDSSKQISVIFTGVWVCAMPPIKSQPVFILDALVIIHLSVRKFFGLEGKSEIPIA